MYPNINKSVKEKDFNFVIEKKYFGVGWTKVYIEKMCEFSLTAHCDKHTTGYPAAHF